MFSDDPKFGEILVAIGLILIPIVLILFIIGIILLFAKKPKTGKLVLIISGCCLLISLGTCGAGSFVM